MVDQIIPLGNITRLKVTTVSGNLHLTGWGRDEIQIKEAGSKCETQEKNGVLEVSSDVDLIIRLPHSLPVEIGSVSGDAVLRGITGKLTVDSVSGDLSLRDVTSTKMKSISGDLIASRVQGDLQGDSISGYCLIEDVQGQVQIKGASGDIQIGSVDGGIDIQASGDCLVDFHPVPWQAYQIKASGDISLIIPADSDADLSIKSSAQDITIFPGKLDISSKENELKQVLGEGGPAILLSAGGKVSILDDDFTVFKGIKMNLDDLGNIASDFTTETTDYIRDSLGHLEEDLRESLSGLSETLEEIGLSEENLKNLGAQIEETSRAAAEKAEIAVIKAQAKVEKKIAMARRKALKARDKTKQFDLNKFLDEESQKKAVSEQERMMILKMLQDKKITTEEADDLLKALEGKRK